MKKFLKKIKLPLFFTTLSGTTKLIIGMAAGILVVMEPCLVMICAAAGVLEFFLEEATTSLGRIIRS